MKRLAMMAMAACCAVGSAQQAGSHAPAVPAPGQVLPSVLYGAAYYNEYMPSALGPQQLDKDVALMKAAHITVVRMGESTWSLWEPTDGAFETAWMDRVVDAMGKAGIKVILGTPTYSIPTWMYKAHPEMLARPMGGGYVGYGMRQNMNTDDPNYRRYAERLITKMVAHYKDNPTVIGWQIDNETSSYGATNAQLSENFVTRLKGKFGTPDALNKAWFLNYWGQNIQSWDELPTRDNATSTSYKLEWTRFQQDRVTDFLRWQAGLVRAGLATSTLKQPQFVTTDFGGMMRADVNELDVAKVLDVVANNPYDVLQDHMNGWWQAMQGDMSRSLKGANYLVTETEAQTLGWSSAMQFPPYDGQARLDVYTHLSSGANMVEYWHWHSIHAGQETYWKGVLSHDLEPNRMYAEVARTAKELEKTGPEIVDLKITNQVAILYSVDSANAISFMPMTNAAPGAVWEPGKGQGTYLETLGQLHKALYDANVGADFVFPTTMDFSRYKLLVVPALYIADDALLGRISDYVKNGGHVLMTFKSGFANENSAVRFSKAPGPLAAAAGFTYQEFSTLEKPLMLKDDPYHAGAANQVNTWAEFLQPTTAETLARYDHPFFGRWPAITRNHYGQGTLTYEGTLVSDALQGDVVRQALADSGIAAGDGSGPVRVKSGVNRAGHKVHYLLNYSAAPATARYGFGAGRDVISGRAVPAGETVSIPAWDLMIVEEG